MGWGVGRVCLITLIEYNIVLMFMFLSSSVPQFLFVFCSSSVLIFYSDLLFLDLQLLEPYDVRATA